MVELAPHIRAVRCLAPALSGPALIESIPHASPDERRMLVAELLGLMENHPQSPWLRDLLGHWPLLDRKSRAAILIAAGPQINELAHQLEGASDRASSAARTNLAIGCVEFGLDPRRDPLAWAVRGALATAPCSGVLDRILTAAARREVDDRQGRIMGAVALAAHAAGPQLRVWLSDRAEPGHMLLRSSAKHLPEPLKAQRALAWLSVDPLRLVALEVIERAARDRQDTLPIFERAHLLRAAQRFRALRWLRKPRALMADAPTDTEPLSTKARRGRLVLADVLPVATADRTKTFAQALTDPSPSVRMLAVILLDRQGNSSEAEAALCDFCFDPDPRIATTAVSALAESPVATHRSRHMSTYSALRRSPHPQVRRIARATIRSDDPWSTLGRGDRRPPIAARLALLADRSAFVAEFRHRLTLARGTDRLNMLMLARRLDLATTIEHELIAFTQSTDTFTAALAALMLGRCTSGAARAALDRTLAHADDRTRASAVEARARVEPTWSPGHALLRDPGPRVRASAVHAMLRQPDQREAGLEHLLAMLDDQREPHRRSALWIAQRARAFEVASRIAHMAHVDRNPETRDRAKRCARRLLAAMRTRWVRPVGAIVTRGSSVLSHKIGSRA